MTLKMSWILGFLAATMLVWPGAFAAQVPAKATFYVA